MSPNIELSDTIYERLASHAQGFDTPERVIERLLFSYENGGTHTPQEVVKTPADSVLHRPEPVFYPGNIEEFKQLLMAQKHVYRRISFQDGTSKLSIWKAGRIDAQSNILGNIYSGVLRDWKQKGITKAEFAIKQQDLPTIQDETRLINAGGST